jgi:3-methylfumaryl-CoA hydratase
MWAAGRMQFQRPLLAGSKVTRQSRIASVTAKRGRSGNLVFVQVQHSICDVQGVFITEEQDIVYREAALPDEAPTLKMARTDEQFSRRVVPDPVLLFRYSALTFNGHRIHYDRPYAMNEEGYAGLVVHGPLIATLLIDQLRRARPDLRVRNYEFRAVSALLDTEPFEVCCRIDGEVASLWARGAQGQLAMQASAAVVPA